MIDLLIFTTGKLHSVQVVKEVLQEFATLSGLKANPSKSNMFCAGINGGEKQRDFDCLR
jgi:DNA repair protein RadC